jgi:hypothetical protein
MIRVRKAAIMANKPGDKMTLQQWAAAGGDVPLSYKGREKSWANQVKRYAAGGDVNMQAGGIAKIVKGAIGKASQSAGMKAPVVAEKDLTTLQDFHTSLGDRVRAGAEEARKMMEGFDYKYDKGQRVFTKDSAAKNRPPYTIIERTRVGNVPMREDMGDLLSKKVIDPETGRAKRTPYEPGYRVRMEHGPEDTWHEFVIPASAIIGDVGMKSGGAVHMQAGGLAKLAKSLTGAKKADDAAKSSLGEVGSMVAKMGEEGRSTIVPVPNRWFLYPDKFPHQQKMVERVLATTGKRREDFPSGAFIDPRTGEVLDSRIMNELGVVIDPKTNRPMMTAKGEAGIERIDPKLGAYTKSNLVRKGLFKPEGGDPLLNDLNFLATIEKGDVGHKYGLATEYASPAELFNTNTGANPTLRPRSRGDLFGVGDVVGQVRVGRSEPHDVYEKLFVAPKGSDVQGVKLSKAKGGAIEMAEGGAAFGRYTTGKKYQAAKKRAETADVNTLADPRTYAFVSGLLGEAPDQLGFSAMHPDYEGIQNVGEKGFMGGTILGVAPLVGPMTKGLPVGASIKPTGAAYSKKVLDSTAARFAEKIAKDNPKLTAEEVSKKALTQATKKLDWERTQKPALEKRYGDLVKSSYADSNPIKQQNTAAVVQERMRKANEFLDQPTAPWTPPKPELQAFDRSAIKDALEGFPGVEQSRFPRDKPARANIEHVEELYSDPANRALIKKQINRGLPLGGETFYASLYPVKLATLEKGMPAEKFDQWIHGLAPASARNSIMNEMAVGQFLRDMNSRGIPLTEENVAREMAAYKEKFGVGLPLMPIHRQGVANVLEGGQNLRDMNLANIPTNYKIPTYGTQKAGDFANSAVLDVHEAGGQTQGSRFHPYFNEQGGFGNTEYGAGEQGLLGIAEEMGIPGGMSQAGRWFGGGELTGLKSPRGDALDLLEKQVAYTLKQKGIQPNPANVRAEVLKQIETGQGDLLPWYRKEGMPDVRETGLQRAEGGEVHLAQGGKVGGLSQAKNQRKK